MPGGSVRGPALGPQAASRPASVASATGAARRLLVALLTDELIFTVGEENVERRQRSVAAGHVLLELHLLVAGELRVRVDLLLEDPQAVADHHDLVEERVERDALLLQPL